MSDETPCGVTDLALARHYSLQCLYPRIGDWGDTIAECSQRGSDKRVNVVDSNNLHEIENMFVVLVLMDAE